MLFCGAPLGNFIAGLRKHQRVAVDTNVLIYQFERNPHYFPLTNELFIWLENPHHRAVTSTVTMAEILVKPYQLGAEDLAEDVFGLLRVYPHLEWIAPDLDHTALAAQLRAKYRLKMVDALQAATARLAGATCLVANDAAFRKVDGLKVLLLDDYA